MGDAEYTSDLDFFSPQLVKYFAKCLAPCKQRLYNTNMAINPYTLDTSADAFEVQLSCLRKMSPQQRIRQTCALSRSVKKMAFDAISRRHPEFSDELVQLKFIELTYGEALAAEVRTWMKGRRVDRNG